MIFGALILQFELYKTEDIQYVLAAKVYRT